MRIKLFFYINNYLKSKIPRLFLMTKMETLRQATQSHAIQERINYYCKDFTTNINDQSTTIKDYRFSKPSSYHFDIIPFLPYFNKNLNFSYIFGDVTHIPDTPSLVKSRPITDKNQNSILFKLNTIRHFIFPKDKCTYEQKKDNLVWRGNVYHNQKTRQRLLQKHFENNEFDIGHVNDREDNRCKVKKLSITEQLNYKFILSIEGNDVATNLKWIMASNSLCFMPKPQYETWFMEGRLEAGKHYVLIKDDFSDLDEKFKYYKSHPDEAKRIIKNAQMHVQQFKNKKQERHIALLVLDKYFKLYNKGIKQT